MQGSNGGDAGRLHKVAETVMAAAARQPFSWHKEWEDWFIGLMGPCPLKQLGSRAFENWMLAAMGSYLAWGYFAEAVKDDAPAEAEEVKEERPPQLEAYDKGLLVPKQATQFTVLGPDGTALIEGKR